MSHPPIPEGTPVWALGERAEPIFDQRNGITISFKNNEDGAYTAVHSHTVMIDVPGLRGTGERIRLAHVAGIPVQPITLPLHQWRRIQHLLAHGGTTADELIYNEVARQLGEPR